jgi:CRP-like cAMP-binding protein
VSQIKQSAVRNRLLTSLPSADFKRLAASLTPVTLSLKQFLVEADEPIGAAYFIETGIISYLNYLEGGEALEIGLIGSEGMLGLPLILGVDRAPVGAMVQMKALVGLRGDGERAHVTSASIKEPSKAFPRLRVL